MKILLISGHGYGDPGAIGTCNGVKYKEADLTREVVSALAPLLGADVYDQNGVVFSQEISCDEESYFAVEAQNVMFYRVEVWDTSINSRLSIGNPIWNTDYKG